jgi:competence ComEA-like helix-hairpin-helix protein
VACQSDFQRLGLESWQARSIIKYRNKGGIFRTPRDFARVYGLTKKQFEKLLPFIRIGKDYQPAANFYPRERYNYGYQETAIRTREERKKDTTQYSYPRKLKEGQYININSADTTELQKIPGIGSYYARSIIRYRERLGGFVSMSQIQEVEGVPETALHYMNIDAKHIRKMNVNQLSLTELRKHPYLNFYQAKEIVNYRRTHGPLKSAEELRLLKDFPPAEIERIKPYLAY